MTILPKATYVLNAILIKLAKALLTELEQKNFTIRMETQKTPNSQSNLEKEKNEELGSPTSDYTTKLQ